jgi:hypothetical protein
VTRCVSASQRGRERAVLWQVNSSDEPRVESAGRTRRERLAALSYARTRVRADGGEGWSAPAHFPRISIQFHTSGELVILYHGFFNPCLQRKHGLKTVIRQKLTHSEEPRDTGENPTSAVKRGW